LKMMGSSDDFCESRSASYGSKRNGSRTSPGRCLPNKLLLCFAVTALSLLAMRPPGLAADWVPFPLYNGEMTSIVMDPSYALTVYVGTRDAGVFKTTDGGEHWQPARTGLTFYPIRCLAVDPQHPNTLYAGTDFDGIWKSADAGNTWARASNGLDTGLVIFNVVVDPQNPNRVYAGLAGGIGLSVGNIYRSIDGGASWEMKDNGIPRYSGTGTRTNGIFSLAIDPANPSVLYAGTGLNGAFRSSDGGESWEAFSVGLPAEAGVLAVTVDILHGNRPAAMVEGDGFDDSGYYVFEGGSWTMIGPMFGILPMHMHFHATNPAVIFCAGGAGDLYRSTDGGITWNNVRWYIADIALHASAPNVLYGASDFDGFTTLGGVYKSTDTGSTWVSASNGIAAEAIRSVAVAPQDSNFIHAGTAAGGIYYSHDGGATWNRGYRMEDQIRYSFYAEINQIAVDPGDASKVYAANPVRFYKSGDHGVLYAELAGVNDTISMAINPQASNPIYVGTEFGGGIYKSSNSGQTWEPKNNGMPTFGDSICPILSLAFDPGNSTVVYAGTQFGGGIVKTIDGGDHWVVKGLTEGNFVHAIAVSPIDSNTVLAGSGFFTGGIYKSTDGGETWAEKLSDIGFVYDFRFDPRNPDLIYAASEGGGVLVSRDGGETWHGFSQGIFYPFVYSLAITGDSPPRLLAGSYGAGLYWRSLDIMASFTASPRTGGVPLEVKFSNGSVGTVNSYSWNFGDGASSTLANPTHTYTTLGTYAVSLTVTGPGGADTETKTAHITVTSVLPTVTVKASDPAAAEPGKDKGSFEITRKGATSGPLTVFYAVTGSAKNGVDYRKLSGQVTFRPGKSSATLKVRPLDDTVREKPEKVKLKLIENAAYRVGAPRGAVVTIRDDD
jgi:photosystem II stability/assembly factor-like uncharacterized protein